MQKTYSPQTIEQECLQWWSQTQYGPHEKRNTYCIVLPPPNITGALHLGHGLIVSKSDFLIRFHRMQGRRVLWQGGTDHAGIATQMVVERQLLKQGQSRHTITQRSLLTRLADWKEQSESNINSQLERLGASIDFSKNRFTLDEKFNTAVQGVLVDLHREGLLYRGKRLVNWDPYLLTAISDLEVIHTEESGWLYYIRYPLLQSDVSLVVATTRPETLFGDMAVAVHPEDERYKHLIHKKVKIPLIDREIPIVADASVDPSFGTGCVKITPAHDFNDYKTAQKHDLPLLNILTDHGRLNDQVPAKFQGMASEEARASVARDLEEMKLLIKREAYIVKTPRGDRSNAIIEPYLTDQWFIHMKPLAKKAIEAIQTGEVTFIPEHWGEVCLQWLENIEDWCISRQLWWGHRIPAWYNEERQYFFGINEKEVRQHYQLDDNVALYQEEDVLDTWVSSALWPFVTLGWPEKTKEMEMYYPTDVLVTAFDIIFFWVARMLMFGLHFTKQVPFKTVYVTGLIRDPLGQKMSKSKGNVLDPIDIVEGITQQALIEKRTQGLMQPHMRSSIEKATGQQFPEGIEAFGADALRMTYYSLLSPTRDIKFDINRTHSYRNFCNKLWQVSRFVLAQHQNSDIIAAKSDLNGNTFDQWIMSRLERVIQKSLIHIENYRLDLLTQLLYDFVWHDYCDWYVELNKPLFKASNNESIASRQCLQVVLKTILQLLHPLIPFITEKLWRELSDITHQKKAALLTDVEYPTFNARRLDTAAEQEVIWLQQVVKAIRTCRNELNVSAKVTLPLFYRTSVTDIQNKMDIHRSVIERLSKVKITSPDTEALNTQSTTLKIDQLELWLTVPEYSDSQEVLSKLVAQKTKLESQVQKLEARVGDSHFTAKAPKDIVQKTRKELDSARAQLEVIIKRLG